MWLTCSAILVILGALSSSLIAWKTTSVYGESIHGEEKFLSSKSNRIITTFLIVIFLGSFFGSLAALGASVTYAVVVNFDLGVGIIIFTEIVVIFCLPFLLKFMWRKGLFKFT